MNKLGGIFIANLTTPFSHSVKGDPLKFNIFSVKIRNFAKFDTFSKMVLKGSKSQCISVL